MRTTVFRLWGQFSTGPRTEAGKARSSRNAVSHGLTSQQNFIMPGEESAFAAMHEVVHAALRAIPWLRAQAGANARLLALGDDITDEDTFQSLAPEVVSLAAGFTHVLQIDADGQHCVDDIPLFLAPAKARPNAGPPACA